MSKRIMSMLKLDVTMSKRINSLANVITHYVQ